MKKIKLVTLTDEEKNDIESQYNNVEDPKVSLVDIFNNNHNQTYLVLKNISNTRKDWGDIEDMVTYAGAMNKIKGVMDETVDLENDEVKLVKRILEESVKNKTFNIPAEKLAEVYKSFCV
jgi:hypothetical protein